jgi:hypothetical protein
MAMDGSIFSVPGLIVGLVKTALPPDFSGGSAVAAGASPATIITSEAATF